MASSGKKGKKNKGTKISLQSFHAEDVAPGVTQVTKKVSSWSAECDEEEVSFPKIIQLPTAPRANRIFDDDSVPQKPPFIAYISNLPFEVRDDDIYDLFCDMQIAHLNLPRDDGDTGRLKGFGYVTFETRDDLIQAISLPDPHIKNRRVRIDISNENDQQRRNNRNNRYDGFGGNTENRESSDWRRDRPSKPQDNNDRRGGFGYNRERPARDSSQETGSGNWRTENRPERQDSSPRRGNGGFRDRDGDGGGGGFRSDRGDRGDRGDRVERGDRGDRGDRNDRADRGDRGDRGERGERGDRDRFGGRRTDFRNRDGPPPPSDDAPTEERPKLNLAPRSLPVPEIITQTIETEPEVELEQAKSAGVPSEKVFGSAKPVDTAAREQEIEERLERERLEKLKKLEEEREEEHEKSEGEKDEKSADEQPEKGETESKNEVGSWRKRENDDNRQGGGENRSSFRKFSPDRRMPLRRNDDRRGGQRDNRDNRDGYRDRRENRGGERYRDNRDNRDRERNERNSREYNNRDRPNSRDRPDNKDADNRQKDEKPKKEIKEKPLPKYQAPQVGPVLPNSNKFSAFLDEDEGSE